MTLVVKNPPANAGDVTDVDRSLHPEDLLEDGLAAHSSILAWRIPWTEESGRLQSMASLSQTRLKQLSTHQRRMVRPVPTDTAAAVKSLQSCTTVCNPIDGSPPGSPVPGILQARTLEWIAISFSNA